MILVAKIPFPKIAVYNTKLIKIITANYANKYFLVIFYNFGSENPLSKNCSLL